MSVSDHHLYAEGCNSLGGEHAKVAEIFRANTSGIGAAYSQRKCKSVVPYRQSEAYAKVDSSMTHVL